VAGLALGLARTAVDALIDLAGQKVPTGRASALREQQAAQMAVAKAHAHAQSARAWLQQLVAQLWECALQGVPAAPDAAAGLMLASTHATWAAAAAVDLAQQAAGASAVYSANPIERAFRDIHAVTQHRRVAQVSFETVGRTLFGLDGADPVLKL
jgi:indole-3-acetate monooxygenase